MFYLLFLKKVSRHISGDSPSYCGAYVARCALLQRVIELASRISATSYPERYTKYVGN